jgi:uncharacterized caspase-like protein
MPRAAVLIGIDNYADMPLSGCEADATALAQALAKHDDGSANFQYRLHVSSKERINKSDVVEKVDTLFAIKDADLAVFYFAGHGIMTKNGGFLVTQDYRPNDEGVPMAQVITAANNSPARERIIILDCCHSGAIDELFGSGANLSLSQGVSILAASRPDQTAAEQGGRGLFTSLICDALDGGAADVRGFVTVANMYAYADQVLTLFDQRPLFKANVSTLVHLRRAAATIADEQLRRITSNDYFPSPDHRLQLDPSFEPSSPSANKKNNAIFADLQQFRAASLVVPDGEEQHLYYAAMNSKSCSLTRLGKYYWRCVAAGKV